MTGQQRSIQDILMDRLKATQDIAEANTEHLRLNQKASGLLVLDMKIERDGESDDEHEETQAATEAALEENWNKITQLEQRLALLDEELEAAMKEES